MHDEFREKYLPRWENLIKSIFQGNVPEHFEWSNIHDIVSTLNTIGSSDSLNHTFFASGGGLDLTGAIESHENGCIELNFGGLINILKPKKLMFEYFPEGDFEWAYFRIVTDSLPDSNTYKNLALILKNYQLVIMQNVQLGMLMNLTDSPYLQILELSLES